MKDFFFFTWHCIDMVHGPQNFSFYLISFFKFSKHRHPPSLGGRQWQLQVQTAWVEEEARHPRGRLCGASVKSTPCPSPCAATHVLPHSQWQRLQGARGGKLMNFCDFFLLMIPHWTEKKYYVKHHPWSYESPLCPDDSSMVFIFFSNTLKSFVNNKS